METFLLLLDWQFIRHADDDDDQWMVVVVVYPLQQLEYSHNWKMFTFQPHSKSAVNFHEFSFIYSFSGETDGGQSFQFVSLY